jgi:hypothetical protein
MDFWSNFQTLTGITQVARICRVSKRTVERWIYGTKPKQIYMDLLYLHDSGRVMPDSWVGRCRFVGDKLDIGHKHSISYQELSHYTYSLYLWYRMLERIPIMEARIDAILRVTPSAQVIDLQRYKDELEAAKKRPFLLPPGHEIWQEYEIAEKITQRKNGC